MPTRVWKLKGYRPEASTVMNKLRGRRSEPIKKGNTIDTEIRMCALYVAQSDTSLRTLAAANHMRLGNVKEILRGWGIDLRTRNLLPWPLLEEGAEVCIE
jgi:hypothetical protein